MILTKNIIAKHLYDILRAIAIRLAAAGEMEAIGRIIKDDDGSIAGQ